MRDDSSRRGNGSSPAHGAPAVGPRQLRRTRQGPGLPRTTHRAVVDLLIRLASTAQYSRVSLPKHRQFAVSSDSLGAMCLVEGASTSG